MCSKHARTARQGEAARFAADVGTGYFSGRGCLGFCASADIAFVRFVGGGPAMADFYSVLARAVSRLPHNDAVTRQEPYARARTVVAAESQGLAAQTQLAALEAAIAKVEAEARAKARAEPLAKILQALRVHEPLAASPRLPPAHRRMRSRRRPKPTIPAQRIRSRI